MLYKKEWPTIIGSFVVITIILLPILLMLAMQGITRGKAEQAFSYFILQYIPYFLPWFIGYLICYYLVKKLLVYIRSSNKIRDTKS